MTPRQPFCEDMVGGRQLRLFEDAESGPATTAGPVPGPPKPTADTEKSRTEPQP